MPNAKRKTTSTKIDIDHVAKLANLDLSKEEKETFDKQLTQILDYVTQVESVVTYGVEPTFNVSSNENKKRPDSIGKSLTQKEALQKAKATKNGQFVTKGVFEQ